MSRSYERRDSDRRDRDSSSSRRDRRSPRRSPSPKPRDDNELPESFGRVPELHREDDNDVLQRMKTSFNNAPLGSLVSCLDNKDKKIKVWTRNFKEVRGICTGYVVAFDKHWNIVMSDVDEVYLKPRKAKTPFLNSVSSAESFPELPKKVPKKKKEKKDGEEEALEPPPPPPPPATGDEKSGDEKGGEEKGGEEKGGEEKSGEEKSGEKKKRKRKRKTGPTTEKRHIHQLFVRGDNIVMMAILRMEDIAEEE